MLFPGDLKTCPMLSPRFQLTYLKDKGKILKAARGWCGGKQLIFTGINIRADSL